MYTVSVIMSTYSSERLRGVMKCIDSLIQQTLQPVEIILVMEPDEELLKYYRDRVPSFIKLIVSGGCGLSNARNTGVKIAQGDIVAFIDDDAIADKHWLKNMVQNYNDRMVLGVGGIVKPLWEDERPSWFIEELSWIIGCSYKGLPKKKSIIRNPIGCNMSFLREVFDRVGYFYEEMGRYGKHLLSCEETEFSIRLGKIPNSKIIYDPSAIVYHVISSKRKTLGYVFRRSYEEGYSKGLIKSRFQKNESLSVEYTYLRYVFKESVLPKLRAFSLKILGQQIVLFSSFSFVFCGYLLAMFKNSKLVGGTSNPSGNYTHQRLSESKGT